ncbi:MAG: hypothetical protein MNPFHGCM_02795 [Gemmatimonadaceae bacterium]|nr:hypothetical protein [Gemmatimonadaceae bacterium]
METLTAVALGLGLAAAAGFRVFVPLLAAGLAARTGQVHLAAGFDWLATTPALISLGLATLIEIVAYYVPWLDHVLDTVATPGAVVAGIVSSAAVVTDLPPAVTWLVAIIGGGGLAGIVQGATVLARVKSTALTGGLGNPVISTAESLGATGTVLLALLIPTVTLLLLAAGCLLIFRASGRLLFGRRHAS